MPETSALSPAVADAQSGATGVINSWRRRSTQAAAGEPDVNAAVRGATQALPEWSALPASERGALLAKAGDILESRGESIAAAVSEETAGTFGWGMFNVGLAAGMFRAAGAVAEDHTEDTVETVIPGLRSRAVRAAGVCIGIAPERAGHPRHPRCRWPLALGNRWCSRPRAVTAGAWCDRGGARGRRRARRRGQPHHQRPGRRPRGREHPHRASGNRPHQLHRVHPGGPHHRREGGAAVQAHAAGVGRQSAAARARRRRP